MCGTKIAFGGVNYDTVVTQTLKYMPEMLLEFLWVLAGDQEGAAPEGRLATLPTSPPPIVSSSVKEVSDLSVSLNIVGVEVGAQW